MKFNQKKAEMGMGTLIIFIAMVLVAAVAASVLITTTGSLQGKALDTGSATKQEVGTNIAVIGVSYNGSDFLSNIRLSPASDSIDMTKGKVSVTLSGNTPVVSDMNTSCSTALKGTAGDTLDDGDILQCAITANASASQRATIGFIPVVGIPTTMQVTVPTDGQGDIFP